MAASAPEADRLSRRASGDVVDGRDARGGHRSVRRQHVVRRGAVRERPHAGARRRHRHPRPLGVPAWIAKKIVSGPREVETVEKTVGATDVLVAATAINLGDQSAAMISNGSNGRSRASPPVS